MLTTLALTLVIVALCVIIHYEVLHRLAPFVGALTRSPRRQVVIGALLALAAHVVEILVFAVGYYHVLTAGSITGSITGSMGGFGGDVPVENFADCVYLSFVTYSTLGFGDIVPLGPVRFMVGTEALTGLVQLAWTASYLYLRMEEHWGGGPSADGQSANGLSAHGLSAHGKVDNNQKDGEDRRRRSRLGRS